MGGMGEWWDEWDGLWGEVQGGKGMGRRVGWLGLTVMVIGVVIGVMRWMLWEGGPGIGELVEE